MMDSEPGFTGPVNLGNPGEFIMLELAASVLKLWIGEALRMRHGGFWLFPNDDPKQRKPDTSLAKEQLGWEPKDALEDGLKETVAYFRKTLNV